MVEPLYQLMRNEVAQWRARAYPNGDWPALAEILTYAVNESDYLRAPQKEALAAYWYIRSVLGAPDIAGLYDTIYKNPVEKLKALGLPAQNFEGLSVETQKAIFGDLVKRVKEDDEFVKKYKLSGLRETLTLPYPSYILALAMGAGKTVLIGSIIATEFALAIEYPDGPFIKNALVFAPGKTILGALRELGEVPYHRVLPARHYKKFVTNLKLTFTRDGEADIPVYGNHNMVVTNTEKIRLRAQDVTQPMLGPGGGEEARELVANRRLQAITSLESLGIFSDEAHHTYGHKIGTVLKRVRETLNYIGEKTTLRAVVNTTGTPYYEKKILRDVICWYGLGQGIRDGILKDVRHNVIGFERVTDENFLRDVINGFSQDYGNIKLPNNAPAKLAIYFPNISDLRELRAAVERFAVEAGINPGQILEVHSDAPEEDQDLFKHRVNDPAIPYRIFLLVGMGTEGWNCPSLFVVALARELRGANNLALQAACRCLRQVPGNTTPARIYLSRENERILEKQLVETYGERLIELKELTKVEVERKNIVLRKPDIKPVIIKRKIRRFIRRDKGTAGISITLPKGEEEDYEVIIYDVQEKRNGRGVFVPEKVERRLTEPAVLDIYTGALRLAANYRLDVMETLIKLKTLYREGLVPEKHLSELGLQMESQLGRYDVVEEHEEQTLAIVRKEGFQRDVRDGEKVWVTEINVRVDKLELLLGHEVAGGDFGFHYTPYNFDSRPEMDFFTTLLSRLGENADDIEDIYFTGALTDPEKSEFFFWYWGEDELWHRYFPDFLLRKNDGKVLIVEIKAPRFKEEAKEKAVREVEAINAESIKYEIIEVEKDSVPHAGFKRTLGFIYGEAKDA